MTTRLKHIFCPNSSDNRYIMVSHSHFQLDDNLGQILCYASFDNHTLNCICWKQMAAVAALCLQYEADFRPNMSIVVTALQPLLNPRPGRQV